MADCAQNCPVASRVEALEGKLDEYQTQNSASHKEVFTRLNALERSKDVQEVHHQAIMDKLDTLTHKVCALEQKPAKRWEALVGDIIKLVVAAIVGFFLARAGLG